jgi:putative phage-type endonuclease
MFEQIIERIKTAMEEDSILILSHCDKEELVTFAYEYIGQFMADHLLSMQKPSFHDDLFHSVMEFMVLSLENIYDDVLEEQLREAIQKAVSFYFSNTIPRRSYSRTFEKPRVNVEKISQIIDFLRSVPQHEQRTKEWYEDRWNMISASSAWKALSSDAHKNAIIFEKCTPLDTEKYSYVKVDSPFHWGQKYEPLSIQIYEDKYKTRVEDFGCIPHKEFTNIGASPDGINTDATSSRYGRMVEVKNRFSESVPITGNPKEEYWIQMQMQMNVCELNECDFLETRFKEYSSSVEFYADKSAAVSEMFKTADGKLKGIYLYFQKDGFPHYEYPPLHLSESEFDIWEGDMMSKKEEEGYEWIKNIYWYLDKMSCVLVFRNRSWFNEAVKKINTVWDIILAERVNGYEHRAPQRRIKKPTEEEKPRTCLINVKRLKFN